MLGAWQEKRRASSPLIRPIKPGSRISASGRRGRLLERIIGRGRLGAGGRLDLQAFYDDREQREQGGRPAAKRIAKLLM